MSDELGHLIVLENKENNKDRVISQGLRGQPGKVSAGLTGMTAFDGNISSI